MKHIATFLMLLLCTVLSVRGQYRDADVTVSDTRIERSGSDAVLSFRVASQRGSVGRDYSVAMQPVITDGRNKVSFPAILIQGKRARILDARHRWAESGRQTADHPAVIVNLLPGQQGDYNAAVEYQTWMEGASLTLEKLVWGCCTSRAPESAVLLAEALPPVAVAQPEPEPVIATVPRPTTGDMLSREYGFVVRASETDDYDLRVSRQDVLTVYYRVSRTIIEPDFDDNRATLNDLTTAIRTIMESSDTHISRIVIFGFASPEGAFSFNERLAQGRAEAVADYAVETTGVDRGLIDMHNGLEDWYGLRLLIEESEVEWKDGALDILADTTALSQEALSRERLERLRSLDGGAPYRYMLHNFFPKLRTGALIRIYYDDTHKNE